MTESLSGRKNDHIRITVEEDVHSGVSNGLEKYRLKHCALPEIDLKEVDLRTNFFSKVLFAPLLISSMTGGTERAQRINYNLALVAQKYKIALGIGSQRAGIERPNVMPTYQVRTVAPDILLFANLGAIQLNYGYSHEQCQRAVDEIQADALILHLNPLQEALQPEGDTNFSGLLKKIEKMCSALTVPIIVKEVGWGISKETTAMLRDMGIKTIDVAGAGGTSWSQVERFRIKDPYMSQVAGDFVDWGLPTADCIVSIHDAFPELEIIASGGLKNGIDVAKSIALGARLAGFAGKLIKPAIESFETLDKTIDALIRELRIAMFCCGAKNLEELRGRIQRIS